VHPQHPTGTSTTSESALIRGRSPCGAAGRRSPPKCARGWLSRLALYRLAQLHPKLSGSGSVALRPILSMQSRAACMRSMLAIAPSPSKPAVTRRVAASVADQSPMHCSRANPCSDQRSTGLSELRTAKTDPIPRLCATRARRRTIESHRFDQRRFVVMVRCRSLLGL